MGMCGVQPRLQDGVLHALADPLPADVKERPLPVLRMDRRQVGGNGDLAALLALPPVNSGLGEMHSPIRIPVRSMTRMAIRTWKEGAAATSALASSVVK